MSPMIRHKGRPDALSSSEKQDVSVHPGLDDEDVDFGVLPKLRLEVRDLSHEGTIRFFGAINAADVVARSLRHVLRLLYVSAAQEDTVIPPTRSVTFILRDIGGGVAYTKGSELDDDHKEIHMSLNYIKDISPDRTAEEIEGVITHELVHSFQYNGKQTCPHGLIEGVADWVRLRCGLAPPHWERKVDGPWIRGYEHTAYFLDHLEDKFGEGTVRRLNEKLRTDRYEEEHFWIELLGWPVQDLWESYRRSFKEGEK